MKNTYNKLLALVLAFCCLPASAALDVQTITNQAFNGYINGVSFQQDAITTYNGYQYAVYWSANRHVAVARRALGADRWQTLELTDYRFAVDNAHYDISLGVSPRDGTLHLSFYQWSSIFNYRKSVAGLLHNPEAFTWNQQLFSAVQNGLLGPTMQPTTYPRFVTLPNGKLLLLLRHGESGAGDSYLYEYDGDNGSWSGLGKLVDGLSSNINAYFNGIHYDDNGRLHATWVWRATPNATTNYDLHYIYSDDDGRTWKNNSGQQIAVTGQYAITQNSSGIRVWQIGQNRGLINQEAQTVDSEGRVSMLMSHLPDHLPSSDNFDSNRHQSRVFHYMRDLNGTWRRAMLPGSSFSDDRNKIAADSASNLYAVINRDGIYRATASAGWQDWKLMETLTDQTLFAEVQIDRQRLQQEDVLSFIHINNQGKLLHFEYDGQTQTPQASDTGGGPKGYIYCAREGGQCNAPQGSNLAYGASGRFFHRQGGGSLTCGVESFMADPIRGTVKRCYYHAGEFEDVYRVCAEEGQTCQINSNTLTQVAFGNSSGFHYRLVQTSIPCTATEFGSPNISGQKQCFIFEADDTHSSASSSSNSSVSSSSSSNSSSVSYSSSSSSSSQGGGNSAGSLSLFSFLLLSATLFLAQRR